jgi:hypothetical protein
MYYKMDMYAALTEFQEKKPAIGIGKYSPASRPRELQVYRGLSHNAIQTRPRAERT